MEKVSNEQLSVKAKYVLGEEHWEEWLDKTLPVMDNKIPREVARTEYGRLELMQILGQMDEGVFG